MFIKKNPFSERMCHKCRMIFTNVDQMKTHNCRLANK